MRRVATFSILVGLTVTGLATCSAAQPETAGHQAEPAHAAGQGLAPAGQGLAPGGQLAGVGPAKLVRYGGYAIDVPVGWPVYWLNRNSSRCVRFDRHAVYLGRPGTSQQCPAHLVGRVGTVSLELHGGRASWRAGGVWQPVTAGRGLTQGQLRAGALLSRDTGGGQYRAVFPRQGLVVTATYGADARLVARLIRTVRWVGPAGSGGGPASQGQPTSSVAAGGPAASVPAAIQLAGAIERAAPAGQARGAGRAALSPAEHRRGHPMKGFDTCTAPSLRVMRIWRRAFKVAAIYLGGPEAACGWGNLSAAWVRAATRMGWALIPTYVGPQAPCTRFSVRVRPGHAEAMGRAAARDAIRLARALGIHRRAPIYDDMEWYNGRRGRCRHPVLAFLDGWTRALHRHGYRSGVYSSAGAAAQELGAASTVYGHRLVKPNSVWFGLWDGRANLNGMPYVLNSWWGGDHRIKQYRGAHWRRIGRARLNIDSDLVNGAVYR